jgi:amino acid transporter
MENNHKRFGTFDGVFTPTILTIIGVILYLRLGWVIGNTGLIGALLIIVLAHFATLTTGLAMASMTTNVKIGDGGFYSIISRSLGLEVGGAIGISLYISQTLSIALYIIGFTEVWTNLYPHHDAKIVSSIILILILILSITSAKIAIKFQYIIMLIIAVSIVSFFMGGIKEAHHIILWNKNSHIPFWEVFAVFFPAVTGISAGAAMSGELKNPKKNIPIGMLLAIGMGFFIYVAVALWLSSHSTVSQLVSDNLIMEKIARWKWAIVAGIMGATLSSALGSLLGAPRILMALGQDRIIPFYKLWRKRSKHGEPRYSLILTALIVEASILLWDLNSIAPLLTMFFLITYSMINIAVFIEKTVGVVSFRPSIKIPPIVSLLGGVWCVITMFLINTTFALSSFVIIILFYFIQMKRELDTPWGDIRSAMFTAISEWSLKTSARLPKTSKSWKPNLMIPIENPEKWNSIIEFIKDIVFPKGTLRLFSIKENKNWIEEKIESIINLFFHKSGGENLQMEDTSIERLKRNLDKLASLIKKEGIFTTTMIIESSDLVEGVHTVSQVMKGMFFPPNIMFLKMSNDESKNIRLEKLIAISIKVKLGLVILGLCEEKMFGERKTVNLWIRDKSPNQNLATLLSLELFRAWGTLRLIRVTEKTENFDKEYKNLREIVEEQRLPAKAELMVLQGDFWEILSSAPVADINIFGISERMRIDKMQKIIQSIKTSCLFTKGLGDENVE